MQTCEPVTGNPKRRPFRFEAAWLTHDSFKDLLRNSWNHEISTPQALKRLSEKLKRWNRDVFGNVYKCKDELLEKVKQVQDQLDVAQTTALLERERELIKELDVVLEQEEILWFQKSREKGIALGDVILGSIIQRR